MKKDEFFSDKMLERSSLMAPWSGKEDGRQIKI
jgi:hypothetical protein